MIAKERHQRNEVICPYCETVNNVNFGNKEQKECKCSQCGMIFGARVITTITYSTYCLEDELLAQGKLDDLDRVKKHNDKGGS